MNALSLRHRGEQPVTYTSKAKGVWCLPDGRTRHDFSGGALSQSLLSLPIPPAAAFSNMAPSSGFQTPLQARAEEAVARLANCGALAWAGSGSDGIELALWMVACLYEEGIRRVFVRQGAYHGATSLTAAISTRSRLRPLFGASSVPLVELLPASGAGADGESLAEIQEFMERSQARRGDVLLLETAPTTGPTFWPGAEFYDALFAWCRRRGIAVIADEVAAGAFRNGWFSIRDFRVQPDVSVVSKGLTNGISPLACVLIGAEAAEAVQGTRARVPGFTTTLNDLSAWALVSSLETYSRLQVEGAFRVREALIAWMSSQLGSHSRIVSAESTMTTLRIALNESDGEKLRAVLDREGIYVYNSSASINGHGVKFFLFCPALDLELDAQRAFAERFLHCLGRAL
ncbi:MAG TPA: aminotransferase class III-fold pyridoxal phosphate-dependent enzyme [Steroidobacteraceae bacterium]